MSDGKCGVHTYSNINQARIDGILAALRSSGSTVTGNNPWNVDTHNHGVKLQGSWNAGTSVLSIIVTDKDWYVPCSKIWSTIDPLINHIGQVAEADVPASADAADSTSSDAAARHGLLAVSNDGKCGVRTYDRVDQQKIDAILAALRRGGAAVTGNNPWDVDTHKHGIKLRGTWSPSTLSLIVTDKAFYVPCGKIWDEIDELMRHIQSVAADDVPSE